MIGKLLAPFTRYMQRKRSDEALRNWEAAQNNRLNKHRTGAAKGSAFNQDIQADLSALRARSARELQNNGFVAGMVETHATDVVGVDGPRLQILAEENESFASAAEDAWRDFFRMPDVNERLSGPELLRAGIRSLWHAGEILALKANASGAAESVTQLRVQLIHPRRLCSPFGAESRDVFMGIRITRTGRPVQYYIQDEDLSGWNPVVTYATFKAADVLHYFRPLEPGQLRGVPWLAPVLEVVQQLRQYDHAVIEAAYSAALLAVLLEAKDPEARPLPAGEVMELEARTMATLPAGYEAKQITPQQPGTQYQSFRAEKLREIGRPVGMPLMMVALDSSKHSFSSARFDGQIYQRGVAALQAELERSLLDPLLRDVLREAELLGLLGKAPRRLRWNWVWPAFPHVDPQKEAKAEETRMVTTKTLTFAGACAAHGLDADEVLAQLGREVERFRKLGLRHPAEGPAPAGQVEDEEDDEDETKAAANRAAEGAAA